MANFDKMMSKDDKLTGLQALLSQFKDQKYPPVHLWQPDHCGDIDIRIAADGTWYYMGTPIGRTALVKLFASVLRKDGDDYVLVTPVEKMTIQVDDAPLFVNRMRIADVDTGQMIFFETKTDDLVLLSNENPLRVEVDADSGEPRPYVRVRGKLEALIARTVFYEMVEKASRRIEGDHEIFEIESKGATFKLGEVPIDG